MSDEVREFHLDGKQLAFLVISAIGVSVVVFLCGVMVGRGVRGLPATDRVEATTGTLRDPAAATALVDGGLAVPTDGRNSRTKPRLPDEDVSYPARLTAPSPEGRDEPAPAAERAAPPAAARIAPAKPDVTKEPARSFDVQVASLKDASSAERERRKLQSKPEAKRLKAFVSETFEKGHFFRVRVGPFPTQKEAASVRDRLKKTYKDARVVPH